MGELSFREAIAKLGFQYAYLIDDKNIDGTWGLTKEQEKWLDEADQVISLMRERVKKCLLNDKTIENIPVNEDNEPLIASHESFNWEWRLIAQAQLQVILKALE